MDGEQPRYLDTPICFTGCAGPIDVCEHKGCTSTQECRDSDVYGADFICVF